MRYPIVVTADQIAADKQEAIDQGKGVVVYRVPEGLWVVKAEYNDLGDLVITVDDEDPGQEITGVEEVIDDETYQDLTGIPPKRTLN